MTIRAKFPGKCKKCGQQINVGDTIEWSREGGARHVTCPARSNPAPAATDPNAIKISGGSGYGDHGWTAGQVIKNMETRRREPGEILPGEDPERINPYWVNVGYRYLYVVSASSRYIKYDGMSFGVGDDSGYTYLAICRLATDEESTPLRTEERRAEERQAAYARLLEIARTIQAEDTRPETTVMPVGEEISLDTHRNGTNLRLYGGGTWFVIGEDVIWYIEGNGADGDDWSRNNIRTGGAGAIGWMTLRHFAPDLADEIKNLDKIRNLGRDRA